MKIDSKYLTGEIINSGYMADYNLSEIRKSLHTKRSYLEHVCKEKNVIHLGCCDHIGIIKEKIDANTWLHEQILAVTKRCVGIDLNEDAINYLKTLGYGDIYSLDITKPMEPKMHKEIFNDIIFDYIIIPDVIEHLDDPIAFLEAIRKNQGGEKIVVTVPNAFRLNNIINAYHHKEGINTDHRYWFTPYTLTKILYLAGYEIVNMHFVDDILSRSSIIRRPWRLLRHHIIKRHPLLRETIICECKERVD